VTSQAITKPFLKPLPDGAVPASMKQFAAAEQGFSLISNLKLVAFYTSMLACRRLAEDASRKRRAVRNADSIHGHEAAIVGGAIDLRPDDTVAHALWPEGAMTVVNPSATLAASYTAATRSALAAATPGKVTVLFSSARQTAQAAWASAITLAAEQNLPALFIQMRHPKSAAESFRVDSLALKRKRYTLPSINVDGNDVVAMYRVATESITHARKGHGPSFIDCRLSIAADPLQNMQQYLIGKGLDPAAFDA
jgi:TPP-dependent pyruvate/acetoin dehydrogenase alpha subunit